MRTVRFLIRKEFIQLMRNKAVLPLIFAMPIIQLVILANAADYEIKNINVFWIDQDQSTISQLLKSKIEASKYFDISGYSFSEKAGDIELEDGACDLVVNIPSGFERNFINGTNKSIQLIANAIDGTKAAIGTGYMSRVIQEVGLETAISSPSAMKNINLEYSFWYNPELNYKTFMVPGILVLLVTMIGMFVASMNIVREKELGTIEQLNVTPIKKHHFILGKLIPLWIVGLIEFTAGLLVGKLIFNIPIVGSLFLLYGFTMVYLVMVLGAGMLISTVTETQQQAMFVTWFFLVVFILMGGLFTPIENMPDWAQYITRFNPIRYFIEVVRMVLLKGATLKDISDQLIIISAYAVAINGLAVWMYRKTT